jgi:general secretion pathway protein N
LPKNVQIANVKGTIWQAHIQQVQAHGVVINDVDSSLSLVSVLMFDPTIDLTFGDAFSAGPEGRLTASGFLSELTIEDLDISVAANDIAVKLELPIDVLAHDHIALKLERFVLGQPICQETVGTVSWQKASVTALDETVTLGHLSATLSCKKGELIADVDPKNDLGLSYSAQIKADGRFSGSGYLQPGAKFPEKLKGLLSFIGNADKQGRYRLKL